MTKRDMNVYQFTEKVDAFKLKYILDNNLPLGSIYKNGSKIKDMKSIKSILHGYLEKVEEKGYCVVDYAQIKGKSFGRYWPTTTGLTSLSKVIRHSIGSDYHIDLDIKNCHPVLLEFLANQYDVRTDTLSEYNRNRDKYYHLKEDVLIGMYGGDVSNMFVQNIVNEITKLYDAVYKKPEFKVIKNWSIKNQRNGNIMGCFMANLAQELEKQCLDCMIEVLAERDVMITSLAFDGLTISKTKSNVSDLDVICALCEERIFNKVGCSVKIVEKKMDQGHKDIPNLPRRSPVRNLNLDVKECSCFVSHKSFKTTIRETVKKCNLVSIEDKTFLFYIGCLLIITNGKCLYEYLHVLCSKLTEEEMKDVLEEINDIKKPEKTRYEAYLEFINHLRCDKKKEPERYRKYISILSELESHGILEGNAWEHFDFKEEHCISDFTEYLRKKTFASINVLKEYMIKEGPNYFKLIQFPDMYIVNRGRGDIGLERFIPGTTSYKYKTQSGATAVDYVNVFDGSTSIMNDKELRSKFKLYSNITFSPDLKVNPHELNTYRGFQAKMVEDVDENLIKPILSHIYTCWADSDDNVYEYILQWFRNCFLYPWKKTGIAIILYGEQGTGKGILLDSLILPYIYGTSVSGVSHGLGPITQRFNSFLMNKLFIVANEVSSEEGFHISFEKLKAIITDPTVSIEKKGIDIFKNYPNHANFIFTTNNPSSVKLGKTDRRYLCLETFSGFRGNFDYFENLHESCTQESANHFFTYVCNLDKTRNIKNIPMTKLKKDMMYDAIPPVEKFVQVLQTDTVQEAKDFCREFFIDGTNTCIEAYQWENKLASAIHNSRDHFIPSKKLFQVYRSWKYEEKEPGKEISMTKFGVVMKKFFQKKRMTTGVCYKIMKNAV